MLTAKRTTYSAIIGVMMLVLAVGVPQAQAFEVIEQRGQMSQGATRGLTNLALAANGGTAFSGPSPAWPAANAIDGSYLPAAGTAFIAGAPTDFWGVALDAPATVDRVAFMNSFNGRNDGAYTIEVTTVASPDENTPDGDWTAVGTVHVGLNQVRRRLVQFDPVAGVTGVRINMVADGTVGLSLSEVEVYAADEAPGVNPVTGEPYVQAMTVYPFEAPGSGPAQGYTNVAPLGTTYASNEAVGNESTFLTDGDYGTFTGSWKPAARGAEAGVKLAAATSVDRINVTLSWASRAMGTYLVQYTTTPGWDTADANGTAQWDEVGNFAIVDGDRVNMDFTQYYMINGQLATKNFAHTMVACVFDAPIADVTGLRVIVYGNTNSGPGIAELEIFDSTSAPAEPNEMVVVDMGGDPTGGFTAGDYNLTQDVGTSVWASSVWTTGSFPETNAVDGTYNTTGWIPNSTVAHLGVTFSGSMPVYRIAFGEKNMFQNNGTERAPGTYTFQYTTVSGADENTPDEDWTDIGTWEYPLAFGHMVRKVFEFPEVQATAVRVKTTKPAVPYIYIDEFEVYAQVEASVELGAPDATLVNSAATVTFPVTIAGSTIELLDTDVTINHTGTAGGTVTVVDGTTATPSIEVSGVTGDGSYTIEIAAGVATAVDGTTTSDAAGPSDVVTVDNTDPVVTVDALGTVADTTPTLTGTVSDDSGIASVEVTIGGDSYTATVDSGAGTWSVDVTTQLANGTYDVVATATDNAGNVATDGTTDEVIVDSDDPVFGNLTVTPDAVKPGDTVTITFTVSKELASNPDVTFDGDAATFVSVDTTGTITYTYTYDIPEGAAPGAVTLMITGEDTLGLSGSLNNSTAVLIEMPLPVVAWPAALALLAAGAVALRRKRSNQ